MYSKGQWRWVRQARITHFTDLFFPIGFILEQLLSKEYLYMYIYPHKTLKNIYADWYVHECIYITCIFCNIFVRIIMCFGICSVRVM